MANYQSQYSGEQIERLLATFGTVVETAVTASGITFAEVVWIKNPTLATESSPVYGIAVHPTSGKLYRIKSTGTDSRVAELYSPGGVDMSVNNTTLVLQKGN